MTFNRTSMECETLVRCCQQLICWLLIEPVWNRNFVAHECRLSSDHQLLIEPVWNRNIHEPQNFRSCLIPFNRTSMESKLRFHAVQLLIEYGIETGRMMSTAL